MKKLIRTFGWSTPPAVALLVVIMLMTAVNATAKVGDTFTKGKLKFTVLTEEGDSGTVNMNIQVRAAYKRYYNYKLNIPENCNKSNIRYKIVSISEIVRVHDNIRPPYNNFPNIIGHISIPNSVTTIGDGAFYGCSGLTGNLVIPNSVTTIGSNAFIGCRGLTSVILGDSVTTIGDQAFSGCSGLTGNLVIPNSVTTIGNYAFNKCTGLTTLTIPSNINNIDGNAFQGCSNLKTLYINSKKIENGAFYDCTALSDIYFGESVTTIGDSTFQNCPKLTKVALPNSVVNITGYNSFAAYSSHIVLPSNLTVMKGYFQKAPDITIPYSACNDNLGGIGNSPIYFMGTDLSVGNFKSSNGSKHTYVKPSVYAQFKNDATYKNLNITDSIPVTFPEGQEYITLCRDFDVDLRHANDHLPLNVKPLKAYIVRDADMDNATAYLDELTYIPSRLKANVEGYKGVDEYVGVVLSGTPGYTYYVQMGEDDYSKGADGQMTVEKALAIVNQTSYDPNIYLSPSSEPKPYLVGAAGDMEVKPTETIDGVTYKNYGLKDGKFVEYEAEGVIPYNHAYLHVPVSSASGAKKSFTMEVRSSFPTTGIREVDASADSNSAQKAAYNLMGMRVGSGYHGIVIVDGKKFIRK